MPDDPRVITGPWGTLMIGHHANAPRRTKTPHAGRVEVPDIAGAEDIGISVRGSVQDGIVGGISQHERPDYRRLNHVGDIG